MNTPERNRRPGTQNASSGRPPEPPKKTARALADGSPCGSGYLIKRAALGILAQAQQDHATDVVMTPATDGGTSVRYRIEATWHDWTPSGLPWPLMASELGGLAGIRDAPYPKEGVIYVAYSGVRLRWQIKMTNQTEECILHDLGNDMV
jgi:hypothetical protein